MKAIYSTQKSDFEPGERYRNPRYFIAPKHGITKVVVIGNWPAVVEGYRAAGIPVEVVATDKPDAAANPAPMPAQEPTTDDPLDIPPDWRDLPWPQLRSLAIKVNGGSIGKMTREDIEALIEAREHG